MEQMVENCDMHNFSLPSMYRQTFNTTAAKLVFIFIFQLGEYLFNITHDIFFFDIPRIFLEHKYIFWE